MPQPAVNLYTRQGCHLCDDALRLLRQYGIEPSVIDIDRDSKLLDLYDHCVPVITIDGHIRFRGTVNEILLRRLLSPAAKPL